MKTVFTTGEVADICKVSQQTVIRCFDSGKLKGFRVPGSRFRRIPRESLMQFMKENQIPLDNLNSGKKRILAVDDDEAILEMLEVVTQIDCGPQVLVESVESLAVLLALLSRAGGLGRPVLEDEFRLGQTPAQGWAGAE